MKKSEKEALLNEDIERYSDMVLRIALQSTKCFQDAQDAVQEVFIRLWKNYPAPEDGEHKKAWLIKVTLNICRDIRRRERFRSYQPLETCSCFNGAETEKLEAFDMLRRLPEHQKTAVYLHYYEGYSIEEISEITGRKPNTVGSDIHRAKKRLRMEGKDQKL